MLQITRICTARTLNSANDIKVKPWSRFHTASSQSEIFPLINNFSHIFGEKFKFIVKKKNEASRMELELTKSLKQRARLPFKWLRVG